MSHPKPSASWNARIALVLSVGAVFFACNDAAHPAAATNDDPAPATTATPRSELVDANAPADAGPKTCAGGEVRCADDCSDLATDPQNCGACGTRCGALQRCYDGACTAGCPAGTVTCGGRCVEPNADHAHCGATAGCGENGGTSGVACAADEECLGGQCLGSCDDTNLTSCSGRCVDTTKDAQNCGACGHACGAGEVCAERTCCLHGQTACMGGCYDVGTDHENCGYCGHACDEDQVCSSGSCVGTSTR